MKIIVKIFSIITFICFTNSTFAQTENKELDWEWAPIGAVWMYETLNMHQGADDLYSHYWYVRSEKDTVYKGTECRKLIVNKYSWPNYLPEEMLPRYTYENGGDIYFYNYHIGEFVMSYSYSIEDESTMQWQMPVFEDCINTVYFDTIYEWDAGYLNGVNTDVSPNNIFMYSNVPLKTFKVSYNLPNSCFGTYVAIYSSAVDDYSHGVYGQYYGTNQDIFELTVIEEISPYFICYCDGNAIINKAYSNSTDTIVFERDSCINYYNMHSKIKEDNPEKNKLVVYPNPFTDKIEVNVTKNYSDLFSVKIVDVYGRIVFKKDYSRPKIKCDLEKLDNGVYFIFIDTKDKQYCSKIIKI